MIAIGQYISYFVVGALYYLLLAAFFSVAAGFTAWPIALVVLALLLGGYASGLSLVAPRIAAMLGGAASFVFLVYSVLLVFKGQSASDPVPYLVLALFAASALAISGAAFWREQKPMWSRFPSAVARAWLGVLIALPALAATWIIAVLAGNLLQFS